MESNKIILGLDPGTNIMGYGLIQSSKNNIELIQYGVLNLKKLNDHTKNCLLYTSPSPRDKRQSRMPSSA